MNRPTKQIDSVHSEVRGHELEGWQTTRIKTTQGRALLDYIEHLEKENSGCSAHYEELYQDWRKIAIMFGGVDDEDLLKEVRQWLDGVEKTHIEKVNRIAQLEAERDQLRIEVEVLKKKVAGIQIGYHDVEEFYKDNDDQD